MNVYKVYDRDGREFLVSAQDEDEAMKVIRSLYLSLGCTLDELDDYKLNVDSHVFLNASEESYIEQI